jgi:hypothetical protein
MDVISFLQNQKEKAMINFKQASLIDEKWIQELLVYCIQSTREHGNRPFEFKFNGVKNVYFAGRTLFIDTKNGKDDPIITISHEKETIGYFTDCPFRRLLSIKTLKLVEELMHVCNIGHKQKWFKPKSLAELFRENHTTIGAVFSEVTDWAIKCIAPKKY